MSIPAHIAACRRALVASAALLIFLPPQAPVDACTTFCIRQQGELVVGKNYDFLMGDCLIYINKRGVVKTGIKGPQGNPSTPTWTSRYGSVTFNPWGREFPFSGINEAGLVISAMGLRKTEYPKPDSRPVIFMAQWIQYHLDRCSTAESVMKSASELAVCPPLDVTGGLHYFVCDASGRCAAIEFLGGKLVCHTGSGLPVPALTNSPYAECITHLTRGTLPGYDNLRSVKRFKTVANMLQHYDVQGEGPAAEYAFRVLDAVRFGDLTEEDGVPVRSLIASEWSVVYDISSRRISFHTFENKTVRTLAVRAFDFSCRSPVKVLDIHRNLRGDVSGKCIVYTPDINRTFLARASKIIPKISSDMTHGLQLIADYPGQTACSEAETTGR